NVSAESDPVKTMQAVMDTAADGGFDSVLLIWDEFGRHLEQLLTAGRAAELSHLQTIAELAARRSSPPLSVVVLTHRRVGQYASTAPQSIRAEWAKVEGRFETIQYIDDSKEMYRLIAETIAARRRTAPDTNQRKWLRDVARTVRTRGIFKELSSDAVNAL